MLLCLLIASKNEDEWSKFALEIQKMQHSSFRSFFCTNFLTIKWFCTHFKFITQVRLINLLRYFLVFKNLFDTSEYPCKADERLTMTDFYFSYFIRKSFLRSFTMENICSSLKWQLFIYPIPSIFWVRPQQHSVLISWCILKRGATESIFWDDCERDFFLVMLLIFAPAGILTRLWIMSWPQNM